MARQNRSEIFDPNEVSVMHCINRAVRRAMLCGVDKFSGKSYEHRRDWIKQRLIYLAKFYGIDVLGYAIMGNHMHVILRNRPDVVGNLVRPRNRSTDLVLVSQTQRQRWPTMRSNRIRAEHAASE